MEATALTLVVPARVFVDGKGQPVARLVVQAQKRTPTGRPGKLREVQVEADDALVAFGVEVLP